MPTVPPDQRAPTLADVARHAGVHAATVSRALSRPEMVAPATRDAVLAAVEALGFEPNQPARQLARGRTDAIGVVVPDITNPYFAAIVRAVQRSAQDLDLAVLIADTNGDAADEARALATLARQVDGIVAVTPTVEPDAGRVPVVQVNRRSRRTPSVVVDQHAVIDLALDHLIALGHRRIAVVRGPTSYWSAAQRDRAAERRAARAGRPTIRLAQIGPVPPTFAGGVAAFAEATHRSTAIVAFNDLQAAGLLGAAHDAGMEVPGACSLVGSDGLDIAAMTAPGLTTVAAPLDELGHVAVEQLGGRLRGDTVRAVTTLSPTLVERASTAPPRRR